MASVRENPGDVNSIKSFIAQYQARRRRPRESLDNLGPWLPSSISSFPDYNEQLPFYPSHWPASGGGKATSWYSVASFSTECTPFSSVFSGEAPAATAMASTSASNSHQYQHQRRHQQQSSSWGASGGDVPDTRELSTQELHVMHELVAASPQQLAQAPRSHRMPCEFARYTGCTETFDVFEEVELWIRHELEVHLGWGPPPVMCLCWFCDDFKFDAAETHGGDRMRNFRSRMMHIAGHFQGGAATEAIRSDFHFLDYLRDNGLVGRDVFERERDVHEAVQIEGLRPIGYKTPKMMREEEARDGVAVNTREEDRERRRRARQQNSGPRDKV